MERYPRDKVMGTVAGNLFIIIMPADLPLQLSLPTTCVPAEHHDCCPPCSVVKKTLLSLEVLVVVVTTQS